MESKENLDDIDHKYPIVVDPKYKAARLTDLQEIMKNQHHTAIKLQSIYGVVNLVRDQGNMHVNLFTCIDVTVLYSVEFQPSGHQDFYRTSLYEFLQLELFENSMLPKLLTAFENGQRDAYQLMLRFISPKRFADEVRKLGVPIEFTHLKTHCRVGFNAILIEPTFLSKFFTFWQDYNELQQNYSDYFNFDPQQSTIVVYGKQAKIEWNSLGFIKNLHEVIYAFMMTAFLKYPQILETTEVIAKYEEGKKPSEVSQLHQVVDFKIIGWGRCNSISDAEFYLQPNVDQSPTTHGETLLFVFKPAGGLAQSLVLTKWLLGTHNVLKQGDMNVTTLNKEFFRRKLRCNYDQTTGVLISEVQAHFHILLNHISFEDAHFQAYVVTAPFYNFAILAIESDNTTIGKIATMFHNKLHDICQPSQETLQAEIANHRQVPRAMFYTMYTFRNFIYKDQMKEGDMMDYIHQQTKKSLIYLQEYPLYAKLSTEWPYPGANPDDIQDTEIQIVNPNPPRIDHPDYDQNDPYWSDPLLQESDDPTLEPFEEGESPISFTKDNLISELCQNVVEFSFRLAKSRFLNQDSIKLCHSNLSFEQKSV